jgi:hypothetical protein
MKRKAIGLLSIIVALGSVGAIGWAMRPVCVPIPDEDLKNFNVLIEQRTDRDFYVKVFQQRDGHWFQCKTALSRFFFF